MPTDSHQPPTLAFIKYLNIIPAKHGTGQIDARAAKRKYYLEEEVRNERLTEGGDFVLSGLCEPLQLSDPQARKFVLCLNTNKETVRIEGQVFLTKNCTENQTG